MTNENSSVTNTSVAQMSFGGLLGESFKMFFAKIGLFLPIAIVVGLLTYGLMFLSVFITAALQPEGSFWILNAMMIVIGGGLFVFSTVQTLALIKASSETIKSKNVGVFEAIGYGFKNLWKGMITMIRSFWYVFWISVLPVMILMILFVAFAGMSGAMGYELGDSAIAQSLLGPGDNAITDISGGANLEELAGFSSFLRGASFLMSGLGIVLVIWMVVMMIYRGTRSMFSMYAVVEEGLSWTAALKKSLEVTKGKFWRIFGYMILWVLVMLALMIPIGIVLAIIPIEEISEVINMLVSLAFSGVMTIFMNKFYLGLKAGK